MAFSHHKRSLAFKTLVGFGWRITVIIAFITLGSVLVTERALEREMQQKLDVFIKERTKRESAIFRTIAKAHQRADAAFKHAISAPIPDDINAVFDDLFPLQPDGTRRSADALFDGTMLPLIGRVAGMGAFLGDAAQLDAKQKQLYLAAFLTSFQVGQAHLPDLPSLYFFTPKNRLFVHAPARPDKLLYYRQGAPADFDYSANELVQVTTPQNNPGGEMRCTKLSPIIYDQSQKTWTTGCHTPVYLDGQHIGAWGSSILLDDLLENAISDRPDGAVNMIITDDGKLIAHPTLTKQGQIDNRQLDIIGSGDIELEGVYQTILAHEEEGVVVTELAGGDYYVAAGRIKGPNWHFVTIYPKELIWAEARDNAALLLYIGLAGLVLALFTHQRSITQQIVTPIRALVRYNQNLARGRFDKMPSRPDRIKNKGNELDHLAYATERMAHRLAKALGTLESRVAERTQELELAKNRRKKQTRQSQTFLPI